MQWLTSAFLTRLIHLPLFNFLLGFPIQLLGLVLLPYLGVKYYVDNESLTDDASKAFVRLSTSSGENYRCCSQYQ